MNLIQNADDGQSYPLTHLMVGSDLDEVQVSSISRWKDAVWIFDVRRHLRKSQRQIKWDVRLSNGELLTDARHSEMLNWLKRTVWGLLTAPGDGYEPMSPATLPSVSVGMAKLVPWLIDNQVVWPHQLTQEVLDHLYEELPHIVDSSESSTTRSRDGDKSHAPFVLVLNFVYYIWRQRKFLQKSGIKPMPGTPWPEEEGANSIAKKISGKSVGWTPPIPDEVAIPLLNAAFSLLGDPLEDIRRLVSGMQEIERQSGSSRAGMWGHRDNIRIAQQRRYISGFQFSLTEGSSRPWHPGLMEPEFRKPALECRGLLLDVIAACCLVISGFTGLRGGDLEELRAGIDEETGLPRGVRIQQSATGLNQEYILESGMPKGSRFPIAEEWLLGSRRIGDQDEPIAVRAMRILDSILRPYREASASKRLVLYISAKSLRVDAKSSAEVDNRTLKRLYAHFLERRVDLSNLPDTSRFAVNPNDLIEWRESKGAKLRPGALRKTFANYVLSTNPELLPAVKRQFQHMNMSMTEGGYWGTNLKQVEPINSVSRQMTAMMLYGLTQNKALGGKMGRQVTDNIDEIRALVKDLSPGSGWRKVLQWVEDNELHVNHSSHGACIPITASRMDCWKRTNQRPIGKLLPNFETRDASMCAGCACFLMNDRHIPYWEERLENHQKAIRDAESRGHVDGSFRELKRRRNQARNILAGLRPDQVDEDAKHGEL